MILGLSHIALYTDKFEETIDFYKRLCEGTELERFRTDKNGCNLLIGDFILEIFESDTLSDIGCFKHIALRCSDADKAYERALSLGAEPFVAPKNAGLNRYKRIAFVKGINKEQIEFCEEKM